MKTAYLKVVNWYDAQVNKITTMRDEIFMNQASDLDIPASPTVTINYEQSRTDQTFSEEYEWQFIAPIVEKSIITNVAAISYDAIQVNRLMQMPERIA